MSTASIVTVQFGGLSNRIGYELWCLEGELRRRDEKLDQPEIQHSILWNTRSSSHNDTNTRDDHLGDVYTPRVVCVNSKSTVGTMSDVADTLSHSFAGVKQRLIAADNIKHVQGVDEMTHGVTDLWGGNVSVSGNGDKVSQHRASHYQSVEEKEDRSIHWMNDITLDLTLAHNFYDIPLQQCVDALTNVDDFKYFTQGLVSSSSNQRFREHLDRLMDVIRHQTETCDSLSGFHIIADVDSGWGGIASSILELLRDEYGDRVPIFTFGIIDNTPLAAAAASTSAYDAEKLRIRRLVNNGIATEHLADLSTLYIPIDVNAIDHCHPQRFHYIAAAIQNFSLPYRRSRHFASMSGYALHLAPLPRCNVVGTTLSLPLSQMIDLVNKDIPNVNTSAGDERQRHHHDDHADKQSAYRVETDHHLRHQHICDVPSKRLPLWDGKNRLVEHLNPFTAYVPEAQSKSLRHRNAALVDDDEDGDIADDADDDHRAKTSTGAAGERDDVIGEWLVLRGFDDKQAMYLTENYNKLHPSTVREYTYSTHKSIRPHATTLDVAHEHDAYCAALYDTFNARKLVGRWVENLSKALFSLMGVPVGSTQYSSSANKHDTVEVRSIIQQFTKDGLTRDELVDLANDVRAVADAYLE